MPLTDETRPARANVLGIGVSAIDLRDAVRRADRLLQTNAKGYICVTGVHGVMEAQRDPSLRDILNRAFLCTPDGMPTVWVGRLQRHRRMRRVYGPDLMLALCRLSMRRGYRHFFYGGKPGVAEKLKHKLQGRFPGLHVVGSCTPPFHPLTDEEENQLVALVAETKPDIIWVGLSTPKQERFMARMIERLDTSLMVGVGAAFDIHAGLLPDAPAWIKSLGLQWLHRLLHDPRRLWRRYAANNPSFLWDIFLQFTRLRKFEVTQS